MPINYYANIDLNKNQLQNARIDNHATDAAAGTGVSGQIYYNTTDSELKVWTTAWESIGSGEVLSVGTGGSTYVNMANTGSATEPVLVASLSATGTPTASKYLRGDNQWVTPPNNNDNTTYDLNAGGTTNGTAKINLVAGGSGSGTDSVIIKGTGGVSVTQTGGEIVVNAASSTGGTVVSVGSGTGILVTGNANLNPTVNVDYAGADNVILAAGSTNTPASADSLIYSDATDSAVKRTLISALPFTNYAGFTLSSDSGSIAVTSGSTITLAGSSGTKAGIDTSETGGVVTFNLDLNEITTVTSMDAAEFLVGVNSTAGNEKMKISDLHLNQLGAPTANVDFNSKKLTGLANGTNPNDAVNFSQLQSAVTGTLTFKGDFNAQSGAITGGGNLTTGGSRVALSIGDYYIVSTAGSFFGSVALDVGDQVIATEDVAAGASVVGDFAVIQGDEGVSKFSASFGTFITGNTLTNAEGAVNLGNINLAATGTPTSSNFLRGDNTWATPANTTYTMMTSTVLGLGKLFSNTTQTIAANSVSATTSRTYGVQKNSSNQLVVNVPWEDTNTQRAAGVGLTLNGNTLDVNVAGTQTTAANTPTVTASRTYAVQVDASDDLVVNVPWEDTNTQLVTSVAAQSGTTSTGSPITVTPTTGAVKVKSNVYNGGSNVGHVPAGGTAGNYLEGDGTWTNPMDNYSGTVSVGNSTGTTSALSYPGNVSFSLSKPMIQLYDSVTGETVFADVDRGSNSFTVTFGTAPPNFVHALITYIKPIQI